MGAPILMLNAHAVARTMCLCKNFSLDPQGNHVLTCKKHTAATRGHNRVMNVLEQLAHKTGYSMRVNLKVSTTADASNKQGDVKLVNFGLDGSNNLVIDVSICCDHHTITQVAAFQAWVTGPCFLLLLPACCHLLSHLLHLLLLLALRKPGPRSLGFGDHPGEGSEHSVPWPVWSLFGAQIRLVYTWQKSQLV
jgi:hypothetical protein